MADALNPGQATGGIAVVSTATGKVMSGPPVGEYWANHARGSVLFREGVLAAATELKCNVFLEVGSQPHLSRHIEDVLKEAGLDGRVVPTLRKGKPDVNRVYQVPRWRLMWGHPQWLGSKSVGCVLVTQGLRPCYGMQFPCSVLSCISLAGQLKS